MKKWTVTITDNETGEIDEKIETNAIIAGLEQSDDGYSRTLFMTHCNPSEYGNCLYAAKKAVYRAEKSNPIIAALTDEVIEEAGGFDE